MKEKQAASYLARVGGMKVRAQGVSKNRHTRKAINEKCRSGPYAASVFCHFLGLLKFL
jgi:hypothetical protein